VLARLIFLGPEVAVPLIFGALAFAVPIRGSVFTIAVVALMGALAFGSIGLLAGSRVHTLEAISGLMNVIMVPMWVLSGVFFSSSNFPEVVQPMIRALPLTALVDALRAVVLEGATLGGIRVELVTLIAWTIIPFSIGLRIFKWR
jgi:ABC-2 type transport system permease protein